MIKELTYDDTTHTNQNKIISLLNEHNLTWLIDSEVNNAIIEIKNDTLIWYDGEFLFGDWYYGIFKKGTFYGNWKNGIFEGGVFKGSWESGINMIKNK